LRISGLIRFENTMSRWPGMVISSVKFMFIPILNFNQ
jgi:hypothetical protein